MRTAKDIVNSMNLGTAKQTLSGEVSSPLHDLLIGLHQEIIDRLTESHDKYGLSASNRLKQSMVTVDQSEPGTIRVAVSPGDAFYWKYINFGVNGTSRSWGAPTWGPAPAGTTKKTFKESITEWVRDRGIKPKDGETYDQMIFGIMRGIKKNGIQPRPFVTDVINKELRDFLTRSISQVLRRAIVIEIQAPTK